MDFLVRLITSSASDSLASGIAQVSAFCAMTWAYSGIAKKPFIISLNGSTWKSFSSIKNAAPALTNARALACCSARIAEASGIRIEGLPITDISATDEAPDRLITNWA